MSRITVIGLGPSGPELVTAGAGAAIARLHHRFVRTRRHPSVGVLGDAVSFDDVYDAADTVDDVYPRIVERLLAEAGRHGEVLYAVPGSPFVAERTVELLRARAAAGEVELVVEAALSYLDLAWRALGVDPLAAGVRLIDGHRFALEAAGDRGPFLVGQCDRPGVLSDIKLAVDDGPTVTVLHHLGLPDEQVATVAWTELDRTLTPDHLTSLWVPELEAPVAAELVRFHDLVRRLRAECPWDRAQTHASLTRHLVEETYELVEAIDALDVEAGAGFEHLEEELGDVLFQVVFHAVLASEEGQFTLADVARGVHDKLVYRHPHVFGEIEVDGADEVVRNWERLKAAEKQERTSLMDGIPGGLPALAYAAKVQQRAASVGFDWDDVSGALPKVAEELGELTEVLDAPAAAAAELGDLLFAVVNVARHLDIDPEAALRSASATFRARFAAMEAKAAPEGGLAGRDLTALDALWDAVKLEEQHRS